MENITLWKHKGLVVPSLVITLQMNYLEHLNYFRALKSLLIRKTHPYKYMMFLELHVNIRQRLPLNLQYCSFDSNP